MNLRNRLTVNTAGLQFVVNKPVRPSKVWDPVNRKFTEEARLDEQGRPMASFEALISNPADGTEGGTMAYVNVPLTADLEALQVGTVVTLEGLQATAGVSKGKLVPQFTAERVVPIKPQSAKD